MDESEPAATAAGALFLIRSPDDEQVYTCFRGLARRFAAQLEHEGLWIEGDVPLASALTNPTPPAVMRKLLAARASMITRIELTVGGLALSFTRADGAGGPTLYRQSYFDELRIRCCAQATLTGEDIESIVTELHNCLHAVAVAGGADLVRVARKVGVPIHGAGADAASPAS